MKLPAIPFIAIRVLITTYSSLGLPIQAAAGHRAETSSYQYTKYPLSIQLFYIFISITRILNFTAGRSGSRSPLSCHVYRI